MSERLSIMPGDPVYCRRPRSKLLGPDGVALEPPTLLDYVLERGSDDRLLPVIEVLSKRNSLLEDKPWVANVSPIVDAKGRPYLKVIK